MKEDKGKKRRVRQERGKDGMQKEKKGKIKRKIKSNRRKTGYERTTE